MDDSKKLEDVNNTTFTCSNTNEIDHYDSGYERRLYKEKAEEWAKCWHEETGEVYIGVEKRTKDVSLESLTGTYRWVYQMPMLKYDYPELLSGSISDGFLELSLLKGKSSKLTDIEGKINQFGVKGHFTGLTQVYDYNKKLMPNYWDIDNLEWEGQTRSDAYSPEGHSIIILNVCDDRNQPFIMFRFTDYPGAFGCDMLNIVGKKQKEGPPTTGLTHPECTRFGIGVPYDDINLNDSEDEGEDDGFVRGGYYLGRNFGNDESENECGKGSDEEKGEAEKELLADKAKEAKPGKSSKRKAKADVEDTGKKEAKPGKSSKKAKVDVEDTGKKEKSAEKIEEGLTS
ncbi:hypothetical protein BDQ12DRAFT_712947 [Crucibulum laeve]|uniref:Uncharacterized protein n=1 Tax=Crucibulum laeve TaxID=68775 RepID=A0A5C3LZR1_9AGAR|nr:hypothetical protein BDQ12DRAFT_712947 [Crucibulum laeve]